MKWVPVTRVRLTQGRHVGTGFVWHPTAGISNVASTFFPVHKSSIRYTLFLKRFRGPCIRMFWLRNWWGGFLSRAMTALAVSLGVCPFSFTILLRSVVRHVSVVRKMKKKLPPLGFFSCCTESLFDSTISPLVVRCAP